MLIVCTGFVQSSRTIPGLFSFFKDSISSQFCIKQRKNALFSAENIEVKRLVFFDLDSGDKNGTIAQIEQNRSHTLLLEVYLVIFTQFWKIFRKFFVHPINPKGLVFYIFQGLIHIFKEILQNSRTIPGQKALFFKFQEFSRTKVKFKNFSRSVRALFVHFEVEF